MSRKGPNLSLLVVPEELRRSHVGAPAAGAAAPPIPLTQRILLFAALPICGLLAVTGIYLLAHSAYAAAFGRTADHYLSHLVFVSHIGLGLGLIPLVTLFVVAHLRFGRSHPNVPAARRGYALAASVGLALLTGLLLLRVERGGVVYGLAGGAFGALVLFLHIAAPILVVVLFILHRSVGREIGWYAGKVSLIWIGAALLALAILHTQDSRRWLAKATPAGDEPFAPSHARTVNGTYIPAAALSDSDRCGSCHTDVHAEWSQSAHRNSSLSNPVYAAAWRSARQAAAARGGDVRATTSFCAACHDPVLLFSGALAAREFADPDYDPAQHPLAGQGITCAVCHGVQHAGEPDGLASFAIDEVPAYPFAHATSPTLRWLNRQLMFQRPAQHVADMRNPLHESAAFCGACHQKALPGSIAAGSDVVVADDFHSFARGNLSGEVVEAAHRPERAVSDCQSCHMSTPDAVGGVERRNHAFGPARHGARELSADSSVAASSAPAVSTAPPLRLDVFGIRLGSTLNAALFAPLDSTTPRLSPGRSYLLEIVVTNAGMGHAFPAGDAASVEAWLDVTLRAGDRVLARSGAIDDPRGPVDPRAYYFGLYAIDRNGRRIDGRNLTDWFVTLEDTRVAAGASTVVRYRFELPAAVRGPLTVSAAIRTRPRSWEYSREILGANVPVDDYQPRTLASDVAVLDTAAVMTSFGQPASRPAAPSTGRASDADRWEDYGRANFSLGGEIEIQQAAEAFAAAEQAGAPNAAIYLAQTYLKQDRIDDASDAIARASATAGQADPLLLEFWSAIVESRAGDTDHALARLSELLNASDAQLAARGFNIAADPALHEQLAAVAWQHVQRTEIATHAVDYRRGLETAQQALRRALEIEPARRSALVLLHEISTRTGDDREAARLEPLLRTTPRNAVDISGAGSAARERDPRATVPADQIYELRSSPTPRQD